MQFLCQTKVPMHPARQKYLFCLEFEVFQTTSLFKRVQIQPTAGTDTPRNCTCLVQYKTL
jgi:hypothetical protein